MTRRSTPDRDPLPVGDLAAVERALLHTRSRYVAAVQVPAPTGGECSRCGGPRLWRCYPCSPELCPSPSEDPRHTGEHGLRQCCVGDQVAPRDAAVLVTAKALLVATRAARGAGVDLRWDPSHRTPEPPPPTPESEIIPADCQAILARLSEPQRASLLRLWDIAVENDRRRASPSYAAPAPPAADAWPEGRE